MFAALITFMYSKSYEADLYLAWSLLVLLSARNVTLSGIAFPNIWSAVGRQVIQVEQGTIWCSVFDNAIAIGSQPGVDACPAQRNPIVGDIISICSSDPKSHQTTFSDRVGLDCATSAQRIQNNPVLGAIDNDVVVNNCLSCRIEFNTVGTRVGDFVSRYSDSGDITVTATYNDRGFRSRIENIIRNEGILDIRQANTAIAATKRIFLDNNSFTIRSKQTIRSNVLNDIGNEPVVGTCENNTTVSVVSSNETVRHLIAVAIDKDPIDPIVLDRDIVEFVVVSSYKDTSFWIVLDRDIVESIIVSFDVDTIFIIVIGRDVAESAVFW